MQKSHTNCQWIAAGLLAVMFLNPAAYASYAVPPENISSGVVQNVDYASNTVTVNGHVYKISPKATYVSDTSSSIGGLQIGMKIQFIANGPVTRSSSKITNVVILPAKP